MSKTQSTTTGTKTVLQVVRMSVLSGKFQVRHPDSLAFHFLTRIGVVSMSHNPAGRAEGKCNGKTSFFLEYDQNHQGNRKPCRLVSVSKDEYLEVEAGHTMFPPFEISPGSEGEVDFRGAYLQDWEVQCTPPDPKALEAFKMKSIQGGIKQLTLAGNIPTPPPPSAAAPAPVVVQQPSPVVVQQPSPPTPTPIPPATKGENPALSRLKLTPEADRLINIALAKVNGSPKAPVVPTPPRPVQTPAVQIPARIVTPIAPQSVNGFHEEVVMKIPLTEIICFQKKTDAPSFSGQPRKTFEQKKIEKLARSLQKNKQLVPALVCRYNGPIPGIKWELIAGERRFRALQLTDIPYLKAIEKNPADKKAQHKLSLLENCARVDPTPVELSNAIQEQLNAGETQVDVMEEMDLKKSHFRKLLAIQTLHPELRPLLEEPTPKKERMRLAAASLLGRVQVEEQVRIWNEAKKQPTCGLIVAKIQELGQPHIQYKIKRDEVRQEEPGQIARRIERRLEKLKAALDEIDAIRASEWKTYANFRIGNDMSGVLQRLSSAAGTIAPQLVAKT